MPKNETENKKVAGSEPANQEAAKKESPNKVAEQKPAPHVSASETKPHENKQDAPRRAASARESAVQASSAKAPKQRAAAGANAPLAHGVGRRKSAVARVWLRRGKGTLVVNKKEHVHYFDTELSRASAVLPFHVYPQASRYDVVANVNGGGLPAQADAVKLGFARALLELNPEIRSLLRTNGLLTVDSRVKERKKYGQKAARRKFQFVKR